MGFTDCAVAPAFVDQQKNNHHFQQNEGDMEISYKVVDVTGKQLKKQPAQARRLEQNDGSCHLASMEPRGAHLPDVHIEKKGKGNGGYSIEKPEPICIQRRILVAVLNHGADHFEALDNQQRHNQVTDLAQQAVYIHLTELVKKRLYHQQR